MIKKIKNIVIVMVILAFIAFIIHGYYLDFRSKKRYINKEFKGVIKEIKYFQNRRGLPTLIINDSTIHLGFGAKVKNYIQVGDSIVKSKGTEKIKVYRKDKDDEWNVKVFK